jgi:hypothetical protein
MPRSLSCAMILIFFAASFAAFSPTGLLERIGSLLGQLPC